MIPYPHFAVANLYLENGYAEVMTEDGVARRYEAPSRLEQCVRRIAIRQPQRLTGKALRFLRRGMGMTQDEFGVLVDRDGQTIARWEKAGEIVPRYVDLAVRVRFAAMYDPYLTVSELQRYLDGTGHQLPSKISLNYSNGNWSFELNKHIRFGSVKRLLASGSVELPPAMPAVKVHEFGKIEKTASVVSGTQLTEHVDTLVSVGRLDVQRSAGAAHA